MMLESAIKVSPCFMTGTWNISYPKVVRGRTFTSNNLRLFLLTLFSERDQSLGRAPCVRIRIHIWSHFVSIPFWGESLRFHINMTLSSPFRMIDCAFWPLAETHNKSDRMPMRKNLTHAQCVYWYGHIESTSMEMKKCYFSYG